MNENCVLLIDDDPADVFMVQRAFGKLRLAVTLKVVNDGDEAIAYLSGHARYADREEFPLPNLLLLDLKMPRKSGFEVLEWIKGQPTLRRLPVIVLTSSNQRADIDRAYDTGANSYLVKTANPEAMQDLTRLIDLYWNRMNERPQLKAE
jgi:CheY-like chemotaxis protein